MSDREKELRTEGAEVLIEIIAELANDRLEALKSEIDIANSTAKARMTSRMKDRIIQLSARYDELQRFCAQLQERVNALAPRA